jgi:hypothetical protein
LDFCKNNEHLIINLAVVVGGRKKISQQHKALNVSGNSMTLQFSRYIFWLWLLIGSPLTFIAGLTFYRELFGYLAL